MKRFWHTAFISMVALFLASCAMPEAPTRTALVYGISIYETAYAEGDPISNNLRYTDDDAKSMAAMLQDSGWTVKAGIADTQTLADNLDATRLAIETDIAALKGTGGVVLFYYSGHGTYTNYGESQIIPFGAIETYEDRITKRELYTMFEAAGLSNVVMILDSCYSGGFVDAGATLDAIPPVFGSYDPTGPVAAEGDIDYTWFTNALDDSINGYFSYEHDSGHIVLSAAGAGELSWESASIAYGAGHGIFTYFLLQSETDPSADVDGDGLITSGEAFAYCAGRINETWNADNFSYYIDGTFADYLPHLSGTPREYALWENK